MNGIGSVPGLAGDRFVRIGAEGPGVAVLLPRHALGEAGGDALTWFSQTVVDADEIEVSSTCGALRATVRHEVSEQNWRIRVSLTNSSTEVVSLSRGVLDVDPGCGLSWVWAAGSSGLVVVEADGALWALAVRQGRLSRDGDVLMWLPDGAELAAGHRVILDLAGRRCGGWDDAASMLPHWLPPLAARGDEPIDLALPDAGLVADDCTVVEGPTATEIRGRGLRRAIASGAFGEVVLDLAFAPVPDEAVAAGARTVERELGADPRSVLNESDRLGTRALEQAAQRLVVLQSAHRHQAADLVADRLRAGVAALVAGGETPGPFALAALAGEVQRRSDPAVLGTLRAALDAVDGDPAPGIMLALTRVWALLWGIQEDPDLPRRALGRVLAHPASGRLQRIEQAVISGRPEGPAQLMSVLGGGLPGGPVPAREPWVDAYAVAMVSLVRDDVPERRRLVHAAELMSWTVTAAHPEDIEVLAWLVLGG